MGKINILGSRFQSGIFKSTGMKVTDRYGWKFIRAAWLFLGVLAAVSLLIDTNEACQSFLDQNLGMHIPTSLLIIPIYFIELGMTFAFWAKLSKKGARLMGIAGLLTLVLIIIYTYSYINTLVLLLASCTDFCAPHKILNVYFDIIPYLLAFMTFSLGAYIQGRFGNKLYSGKTVAICLVIILTCIGLRFLTKYGDWGTMGAGISYSVTLLILSRSRLVYKVSRPIAIKSALFIFVIATLTYIVVTDTTYDDTILKALTFMLAPFIVINLPRILTTLMKWTARWIKEY